MHIKWAQALSAPLIRGVSLQDLVSATTTATTAILTNTATVIEVLRRSDVNYFYCRYDVHIFKVKAFILVVKAHFLATVPGNVFNFELCRLLE